MVASIFKKLGIGTKNNNEKRNNDNVGGKMSPLASSSLSYSDSDSSRTSEEAEAILTGISKRVYV